MRLIQVPYRRPVGLPARLSSSLIRLGPYRAQAHRLRPKARAYGRELLALEFGPADLINQLQLDRLREMVAWACQSSAYYASAAKASGFDPLALRVASDLASFPVLTKSLLRSNLDSLLAGGRVRPEWEANASGGSTGEPVRLYQDQEYWNRAEAAQAFMEGWWGVRPGEPMALLWGADRDLALRGWKERAWDRLQQRHYLNAFKVDEAGMARFADLLARWQPVMIAGYATALELFARFLLQEGRWEIRPKAVKSTAERLTPEARVLIERAFAAPVFDFYGSREVNMLAAECQAHDGLHVNTWSRFLEVVDGEGRPQPPGVPGRILVTDLVNHACPLIRYENGDVGEWAAGACECGRPFPRLTRVLGRKSDFIHAPGGKLIHGEYFTHLFYDQPGVRSFQVSQTSLSELLIEVEMSDDDLRNVAGRLEPSVQAAMGPGVRVRWERVYKIERSASGKRHFTRSELDMPWPTDGAAFPR